MELRIVNQLGEDTGRKAILSDDVFGIEPNEHAMYLDVKQYLANQRQGTHKAKERAEISRTTKKLHKQIRRKLDLKKDYDPNTGKYLEEPDYLLPNYQMTQVVHLNVLADYFFDLPNHEVPQVNKKYLSTTRASLFAVQCLAMFECLETVNQFEEEKNPELA